MLDLRGLIEQMEKSDALEHLRTQVRRGTFEESVVSELQVLRATMVRLVLAVSGDKSLGADGLVERTRALDARLELLEKIAEESATAKRTTFRTLALISTTATAAGSVITWALQWFAR